MPKYSRIQLNLYCRTCDEKLQLSIYYGRSSIWNNKDAGRLVQWQAHETHDTEVVYKFVIGDTDTWTYADTAIESPPPKRGRPPRP